MIDTCASTIDFEDSAASPWRRASRCNNSACVEIRIAEGVSARNSRRPEDVVVYDRDEWRVFVAAVKAGEFDVD